MKRTLIVLVLAFTGLLAAATPASADVTFFLGFSTNPETRPARGFAGGFNFLLFGFEFDYANTSADEAIDAPNLKTGMINGLIMTPTKHSLYLTLGGGFYKETSLAGSVTSFGTNIGGGVKISLIGPVQVRVDYRIFNLRGDARFAHPQRFYTGLNLRF
jgi:hypothetical protein